jgi:hypothetical protein
MPSFSSTVNAGEGSWRALIWERCWSISSIVRWAEFCIPRGAVLFNMTQLTSAGLDRSKNPTLQKLFTEVSLYNGLPRDQHAEASRLLDKIMKHAAVYLTSKKPQAGAKNQLRWTAMTNLVTEAATEAQGHGVKLLHSPADFRAIKGDVKLGCQSYWLERVDPLHRPGFVLSQEYETWIGSPPITMKEKQSFWEWLGNRGNTDSVMMVKGDDGTGKLLVEGYRITFDAGVAKNSLDEVYCTRDASTAHSGAGWAIFACSPSGGLYARPHEIGFFHHSSFLAGKPVAAAGEVLVDEAGKVKIITAKTGHYRVGSDEMRRLLTLIPDIPGDAFILPDWNKMYPPPLGQNQALLYRCDDFRKDGTAAAPRTKALVAAAIPAWANTTTSVKALINKSPVA